MYWYPGGSPSGSTTCIEEEGEWESHRSDTFSTELNLQHIQHIHHMHTNVIWTGRCANLHSMLQHIYFVRFFAYVCLWCGKHEKWILRTVYLVYNSLISRFYGRGKLYENSIMRRNGRFFAIHSCFICHPTIYSAHFNPTTISAIRTRVISLGGKTAAEPIRA